MNLLDIETLVLEIVSSVFIWTGVILMVIASIGIIRLPDFYIRMSAITKAATLGVGFIVTGIAVYFNEVAFVTRAIMIIVFLLLTSPIAAHIIARAAYMDKVPFWSKTLVDEFKKGLQKEKDDAADIKFSDAKGKEVEKSEREVNEDEES